MLYPLVLDTDLSLESQFVSLLHVSEEIIKAAPPRSSPQVAPNAAATQLHCVGVGGCMGVEGGRGWQRPTPRTAWVHSVSQERALSILGEGRRKHRGEAASSLHQLT